MYACIQENHHFMCVIKKHYHIVHLVSAINFNQVIPVTLHAVVFLNVVISPLLAKLNTLFTTVNLKRSQMKLKSLKMALFNPQLYPLHRIRLSHEQREGSSFPVEQSCSPAGDSGIKATILCDSRKTVTGLH